MQKIQNVFPIHKLETNQKVMDLAEKRGQIYCRVAIKPQGGKELSEEQKAMLAKLSEKQRITTNRGELNGEISNIFPISVFSEYVDGLENTAANSEYFGEETQEELVDQLAAILVNKEVKEEEREHFIFTYYTESVKALLAGTEYDGTDVLYYESDDGTITRVRQRNNLYFGFFDEAENALSFMQSRLLSDIDDGNLLLDDPSGTNTAETPAEKPAEKPKKPIISLKRK